MLHDIPPKDVQTLKSNKNQVVDTFEGPSIYYIGLNVEKEPTNDKAVRQALALAVDRELIVDKLMYGQATPAYGYIGPVLAGLGYHSSELKSELALAYNPDKAKRLLDAAGWKPGADGVRAKDGKPLELDLWVQNLSPKKEIAEAVQSMAASVGMRVKVMTLESSAFWNTLKEGRMNAWFGDGQMRDPDLLSYHLDSSRIPATNRYRYTNAAVDKLLADARSTPDRAARDKLYWEIQKIVATDAVGVAMFYPVIANAHSSNLANFQVYKAHDEYPLWTELTVK